MIQLLKNKIAVKRNSIFEALDTRSHFEYFIRTQVIDMAMFYNFIGNYFWKSQHCEFRFSVVFSRIVIGSYGQLNTV